MKLITSNKAKYEPFKERLKECGIEIVCPPIVVHEIQSELIKEVAEIKARDIAKILGEDVLIDEAGLELKNYPYFPGAMTKYVLKTIGRDGLKKLAEPDFEADMICVLAWSDGNTTRTWEGRAKGKLDFSKKLTSNSAGVLSDWFVCEEGPFFYRKKAIDLFINDWL